MALFRVSAGTWLLFAFITTSSYAGNLKATRLNPVEEHPINNVHDIVHSGLEWHMFNYGDYLDYHISQQEGEDYKTFLRDRKEIVSWLEVPYQEVKY